MKQENFVELIFGDEADLAPDVGVVSDFLRYIAVAYIYSRKAHSQLNEGVRSLGSEKLIDYIANIALKNINSDINSTTLDPFFGKEKNDSYHLTFRVRHSFGLDQSQLHIDKLYSRFFDNYSIMTINGDRSLLDAPRILDMSFNSPFKIMLAGSVLILSSAVSICGGELEFSSDEVSAKATLPGLIQVMERVHSIIYKEPEEVDFGNSENFRLAGKNNPKPDSDE